VTPAKRGKGSQKVTEGQDEKTPAQRHVAMTWAQRLEQVFGIDVAIWRVCGGAARVIACIEDPVIIKTILTHSGKIPAWIRLESSGNDCSMGASSRKKSVNSAYTQSTPGSRTGTRMVNTEPSPSLLLTVRSPPSIWQKRRDIGSPRPVPP